MTNIEMKTMELVQAYCRTNSLSFRDRCAIAIVSAQIASGVEITQEKVFSMVEQAYSIADVMNIYHKK